MALFKSLRKSRLHFGVLALALVLVVAQSLGILHSIVHTPQLHIAPIEAATHHSKGINALSGFATHLFDSHLDSGERGGESGGNHSVECQLFDQYSHFDGFCQVQALVLPTPLLHARPLTLVGLAAARWLAAFQARGPPVLR